MKSYLAAVLAATLLLPVVAIPAARTAPHRRETGARPAGPDPLVSTSPVQGPPVVRVADGFAESVAVKNLPAEKTGEANSFKLPKEEREIRNREEKRKVSAKYEPSADEALQPFDYSLAGEANAPPPPALTFNGLSNNDNWAVYTGRVNPPDTNGDVGPNHYVQVTNLLFRVYSKAGAPLTPPRKLSSLFAPLGEPCGNRNDGDPIVLYDPLADRWMLSQFCFAQLSDIGPLPPYHQLIAVSQTNDPTGKYYLYDFMLPGNNLNDYPHFGVWSDGYYMTDNQFREGYFNGVGAFAFDRQKMLAGDPTASYIYFNQSTKPLPAGMLPADIDGLTPPPAGAPCPFAYFTADEYGDPADGMRIFDFHADFAVPSKSYFKERPESAARPKAGIPVAAFDPTSGRGREDVPQPQPANYYAYLDAVSDVLMHRLQYRNFGNRESLVVTHTVDADPGEAKRYAIRYYEFRKPAGNAPYVVHEQGTYAGQADSLHRWMGSAAMNNAGDLAVAYSVSSLTVFPSIRYAARLSTDAPGALRQGEQTIYAGLYPQLHDNSRWGDYSNLSVDPADDCTFWYTTLAAGSTAVSPTGAPGWVTKISKFSFGKCVPAPRGKIQGIVTNALTGLPIPNAVVRTTNGYSRNAVAGGSYSINPIGAGTYTLAAAAPGYALATVPGVAVTNGGTTVQNIALTPVNLLTPAGAAITSAGTVEAVMDPGETVTVNLSLKNLGAPGASTINLLGTLRPTGGVVSPAGPQFYGAIAGGATVTRPFTFKVDPNIPCGGAVTATLALTDGTTSYGSVVFKLGLSLYEAAYTGPALYLPDYSEAGIDIPVKVSNFVGTVYDLDFKIGGAECTTDQWATTVGLNHTWTGAVRIKLRSPSGKTVTLVERVGGNGHNFCQTYFDDDAITRPLIQSATGVDAPFTGPYRPMSPLSAFDGENPNGTWVVNVADVSLFGKGHVRAFSLLIWPRRCAPPNQTFTVGGQIKVGTTGVALGGVKVKLTSDAPAGFNALTTQTDSNGYYSFAGLPVGRDYIVTPTTTNYTFNPISRTITKLAANLTNQNFPGTLKTYTIIGYISRYGGTESYPGVPVTITSPTPGFTPRTYVSNSGGYYVFFKLPAERTYVVRPAKNGYTFTPASREFTFLSSDLNPGPDTNFASAPTTPPGN